jgi:hypothetical protein
MQRGLVITTLLAACATGCGGQTWTVRSLDDLRAAPLYSFNPPELAVYLRWLSQQEMPLGERVALLARRNIGQPYRLGLLGEFPFELYDPDPMCCLAAGDCVTFVEQTYAMALSHDWASFFRLLQRIRYKEGRVGLATRNHFMEADWNVHNAWLFDDITMALSRGNPAAMRVRIDRSALLARHGIAADVPIEIIADMYLPRDRLSAASPDLRDGDIVEIVRGDEDWQWISHVGLIARSPAGQVTMIHSSSPKAREQPLDAYLRDHTDVLGVKVLRPKTPRLEEPARENDHGGQIVRAGRDIWQ